MKFTIPRSTAVWVSARFPVWANTSSCGTAKKPPVNGFLYRSPHTAMTPLFFSVSIMQSSSLMTGKSDPSKVSGGSPSPGSTPMPTTHGRRPSLMLDRCRAISTTMPLPTPPARLNTTPLVVVVFSLAGDFNDDAAAHSAGQAEYHDDQRGGFTGEHAIGKGVERLSDLASLVVRWS